MTLLPAFCLSSSVAEPIDQVRWMGQQLGFLVIQTFANFIGTVDEQEAQEVRIGLGFRDLKVGSEASPTMIKAFAITIPREAAQYADVWKSRCSDPVFSSLMTTLETSTDDRVRAEAIEKLELAARAIGLQGWRLSHSG